MKKNLFLIFFLQFMVGLLLLVSCTKAPAPIVQLPPTESTPETPLVPILGTPKVDGNSQAALAGPWTYLGDGKYVSELLIPADSLLYPKWSYGVNWAFLKYGSQYMQIKSNLAVVVENGTLTLSGFRLYFQSTNDQPPSELSSVKINFILI